MYLIILFVLNQIFFSFYLYIHYLKSINFAFFLISHIFHILLLFLNIFDMLFLNCIYSGRLVFWLPTRAFISEDDVIKTLAEIEQTVRTYGDLLLFIIYHVLILLSYI